MVVPLMNLCRSQWKVYPNQKGLLWDLLLRYAPLSLWNRAPCLGIGCWTPLLTTRKKSLQVPPPPTSPSYMCLATCHWWGRRCAASGQLLRLCPHGQVRGARFVAFCFVGFCKFRDSAEYGVARARLSELSCFYEWNQTKSFPGAYPHEEHDVKMSASDVHVQNKIWMLPQPTN